MQSVAEYLPTAVNSGRWLTRYTLDELKRRIPGKQLVLPICSLGTPLEQLESLAEFVLPPLYHEALDPDLQAALLERIRGCFPFFEGTRDRASMDCQLRIVEIPPERHAPPARLPIVGFSVDTAVEEHGPHLPLMTDTIQSYAVLRQLAQERGDFLLGPPVEYGHLTWGLPFGLSIDITPPLLTRYVTRFANALQDWMSPAAMYVVDVHGSIVHRRAIEAGLEQSRVERWAFRWLHEPLVEFAAERGDQHAGGVETALVEYVSRNLVDGNRWPGEVETIASREMDLELAVQLASDLPAFIAAVEAGEYNGIVGRIRNYFDLEAADLFQRMLNVARSDVAALSAE